VAAIVPAAGFDQFNNAVLAGVGSYNPSTFAASRLNGNTLTFFTAASQAGPYTAGPEIFSDAAGNLNLLANLNIVAQSLITTAIGIQITNGGLSVIGGITADTEVISSGQGGGILLDITNTIPAPTAANMRLTCAAAGDRGFGVRVAGDGFNRMQIDPLTLGGRLQAGPGNVAADVALYRGGNNQWAADYLAFNNAGVAETWQVPTFGVAGWVNSGAPGANLQYRRNSAPYKTVQWGGRITAPAGVVAGQNITTAVPAPYRPTSTQPIPCRNITNPGTAWLSIGSAGILQFQSGAIAADVLDLAPTEISLDI